MRISFKMEQWGDFDVLNLVTEPEKFGESGQYKVEIGKFILISDSPFL